MRYESTALREERASLHEQMKGILDAAEAESRSFTAEETQEYDRIEARFSEASDELRRVEVVEGYTPEQRRVEPNGEIAEQREGPGSDEYRDAFNAFLRGDDSSEVRVALKVGTDANGGYVVPDSWAQTIIDTRRDMGAVRQLADVLKTGSGEPIHYPRVATDASVVITAEEAAFTEAEPTFDEVVLYAYKLGVLVKASDELVADSIVDLGAFIGRHAGQKLGQKEAIYFATGTGSGQPQGIVNATVGKTAAGAAAITADELIDLMYSTTAPYRSNGAFVMNDTTLAAVRKLKGSDGQYIWASSLAVGNPDTILGRPALTDPNMPILATGNKTVVFGDFKAGYLIREVGSPSVKQLNELYAVNGQVGWVVSHRVDGKIADPAALRVLQQA